MRYLAVCALAVLAGCASSGWRTAAMLHIEYLTPPVETAKPAPPPAVGKPPI